MLFSLKYDIIKRLEWFWVVKMAFYQEDFIDEVLSYMYENDNMSEKPKEYKTGPKVLEFKPRKKV